MDSKPKAPASCDIDAGKSCCCSESTIESMAIDHKQHWNKSYENSEIDRLGWYEEFPAPSLRLIEKSNIKKNGTIFNAGAGATTLIDELLKKGFNKIIVNDISPTALEILKNRLSEKGKNIMWIEDDLTKPTVLKSLEKIDLWHDRAVMHFFHEANEQKAYFDLLRSKVKKGGFAILAAFNLNGAKKCSGLPVYRYDASMIQERLGEEFELIEAFDYTYNMPSKDTREYIYTLFKRK